MIYINFTPIYESILNHNKKDFSSFHTPGHKSNFPVDYNFNTFDLTELPDTDSLYEANDSILRSEINASKIFNSKNSELKFGVFIFSIILLNIYYYAGII